MKDIILSTEVKTPSKKYTKGVKYNISDTEFSMIAMFSDIKEMEKQSLDTTGIQEIIDIFKGY